MCAQSVMSCRHLNQDEMLRAVGILQNAGIQCVVTEPLHISQNSVLGMSMNGIRVDIVSLCRKRINFSKEQSEDNQIS